VWPKAELRMKIVDLSAQSQSAIEWLLKCEV
jgi:hypothetical protein